MTIKEYWKLREKTLLDRVVNMGMDLGLNTVEEAIKHYLLHVLPVETSYEGGNALFNQLLREASELGIDIEFYFEDEK